MLTTKITSLTYYQTYPQSRSPYICYKMILLKLDEWQLIIGEGSSHLREGNWHYTNYGYPILSMKFTKNEEVFMKEINITPTMAILSYQWNLQRMKMFLWRKLTLHQLWLSHPVNEIYKEWRCFYEENWYFRYLMKYPPIRYD